MIDPGYQKYGDSNTTPNTSAENVVELIRHILQYAPYQAVSAAALSSMFNTKSAKTPAILVTLFSGLPAHNLQRLSNLYDNFTELTPQNVQDTLLGFAKDTDKH